MDIDKTRFWNLIAGKLNKQLDEAEESQFDAYLKDGNNKTSFKKSQKIHSSIGKAYSLRESDDNLSWNKVEYNLKTKRLRILATQVLRYAAIIIFAFILGIVFNEELKNAFSETRYAQVEVPNGQTGHIFLFDGTEVWLNSGTSLKYPETFNNKNRDVELSGEAYFKVAPNKNLPFKVKTNKLEVEVLGTSFNVSAYQDDSNQSVVLVEGKVQLNGANGKKITEIRPGQMAVRNESSQIQIKEIDASAYTSWKDGKVSFNGERMEDIARKLERWFNVEINFEDENLRDFKFTGTILRNKPIDQTIMAFELLAPIKFNYQIMNSEKDQILIRKR